MKAAASRVAALLTASHPRHSEARDASTAIHPGRASQKGHTPMVPTTTLTAAIRVADALGALDTACAIGDEEAVTRYAEDAAIWWGLAEAEGATTALVRALRAGGAR